VRHLRHTLRGRLTVAAVLSAALALVVLTGTFNLLLREGLRSDLDSRLRAHATAVLSTIQVEGTTVRTSESAGDAALDDGTWVFAGDPPRAIERANARPALQAAAVRLARSGERWSELDDDTRLHAVPIVDDGRRVGTVVAAVSLAGYERTTKIALVASALFALAVLVAVAFVAWLITGAALRPVKTMTEQAADWSDHELDQRFGAADRPDELGALAATFDTLLDRIAASLRQEQRLSAELSHELRTPLAKVVAEADLLLRRDRPPAEVREGVATIRRSAEQMTGILDTLMAAARAEAEHGAPGRSDVLAVAARLAGEAGPDGPPVGVSGDAATAGVEGAVVERILAPLLDNARRHAVASVAVTVTRGTDGVVVDVVDDGPGVPADDVERVFEPGVTAGRHGGAGLGLPLARRLARASGGDVTAAAGPGGRFRARLPAA
jgi:signal transduction histidine kinase